MISWINEKKRFTSEAKDRRIGLPPVLVYTQRPNGGIQIMEDLLQVGVITQTHGIRGEVKVFPTTDDPGRFSELKHVKMDTGKETLPLEIEKVKFFMQFVILIF